MMATIRQAADWTGLILLSTLVIPGCSGLNPEFVSQLGGNAGQLNLPVAGTILVALNNQTPNPVIMTFTVERTLPGETTTTSASHTMTLGIGNAYFVESYDCNVTGIVITGIELGSSTTTTGGTPPAGGTTTTTIVPAVNEFRRGQSALQCGSVLFVNIPPVGAPTAEILN